MASTPSSGPTPAARPVPKGARTAEQKAWVYGLLWGGGLALYKTVFRMRVLGVENVPREGGVVLASLHRSNFDTFLVGVPPRWRKLRPMAKVELYRNPALAWVLRNAGAFPVRRGEGDREAIATAIRILRDGGTVAMYPEGTRNRDGQARLHSGAARLALSTRAALVPVAVKGTDEIRLWPPRIPRFEVAYGPPIPIDDLRDLDTKSAADVATERWKDAVTGLLATFDG
jgi:1-acyl-sn-glycerol-3-phosphate acyltransferase